MPHSPAPEKQIDLGIIGIGKYHSSVSLVKAVKAGKIVKPATPLSRPTVPTEQQQLDDAGSGSFVLIDLLLNRLVTSRQLLIFLTLARSHTAATAHIGTLIGQVQLARAGEGLIRRYECGNTHTHTSDSA